MSELNTAASVPLSPNLLPAAEVAERLGVSPATLGFWRRSGQGPRVVRLSPRVVRYDEADVVAFISAGRSAPASQTV